MDDEIWYKTYNGAILCHVSRIIPDVSEIPCVTSWIQNNNFEKAISPLKQELKAEMQ